MSKPELRLDWCSHEAAKYAVMNWHYSKAMPSGKLVKIGVWESGQFIGVVLFSRGANPKLGNPYGLGQTEIAELSRIALNTHRSPVSRIGAIAIRLLRKQSPGLRLLVSFADPEQGHVGGVYQAMGWTYAGLHIPAGGYEYMIDGKWVHTRSLGAKHGTRADAVLESFYPNASKRRQVRKHRYLYPLDKAMREQIAPLAKPYPKRQDPRAGSVDSDTSAFHVEEGGANPTPALQDVQSQGCKA